MGTYEGCRERYAFRDFWNRKATAPVHLLGGPCQALHLAAEGVRRRRASYPERYVSTIVSHIARMLTPREVGEDEEVSIKEVADAIVKAVGFEGEYTVTYPHAWSFFTEANRGLVV